MIPYVRNEMGGGGALKDNNVSASPNQLLNSVKNEICIFRYSLGDLHSSGDFKRFPNVLSTE